MDELTKTDVEDFLRMLAWKYVERYIQEEIEMHRNNLEEESSVAMLFRTQGAIRELEKMLNIPTVLRTIATEDEDVE